MASLSPDVEARFNGLRRIIGNTPLLAIDYSFRGRRRRILAKSENLNMTGSLKDRMALHVLRRAYEKGALLPGAPIVESACGNTGISLAAVGRALGHPVTIFMPPWASPEQVGLLRAFGAVIHPVSECDGGLLGSIARAEEWATSTPGAFLPRQFTNLDNCGAHEEQTGPEIHWQLDAHGLRPDAFVAGVGTGGTIMGVGRYLRAHHPAVTVHPLEPASAPVLSDGGSGGHHRIRGIAEGFLPPIVSLAELDDTVTVDDGDAVLMAQKLAREAGLGVGISSGANFLGAVLLQNRLGDDAVVVTVFPDDNKKYLSTDLRHEEPVRPGYVAPHVTLHAFTSFNRACQLCDPSESVVKMAGALGL